MKDLRAERIRTLPPYLFAEIDRIKRELKTKGVDVIDLSIGDPDLPTPDVVIQKLAEEARRPANHRYPAYIGSERFRKAVSFWYEDRFGVRVDPNREVIALIGSKEGIAHLPLAYINPGDVGFVPNPGYPVYSTAISFAGGEALSMPLRVENRYFPDLNQIPESAARKAKLLFFNYPNNPTSAVANQEDFERIVHFCRKHDILACHDAAYSEVAMGGYEPLSFLEVDGAEEVGIEFHSLSKTFNMTGWRIGFAVGNARAIEALAAVKSNIDSGVFTAVQEAGIVALERWRELRDANNSVYEHRRDLLAEGLKGLGIEFQMPRASFYFWCKVPRSETSAQFCAWILEEAGVCLTPGTGFGSEGEGYFRFTITASEVRIQEALARLKKILR